MISVNKEWATKRFIISEWVKEKGLRSESVTFWIMSGQNIWTVTNEDWPTDSFLQDVSRCKHKKVEICWKIHNVKEVKVRGNKRKQPLLTSIANLNSQFGQLGLQNRLFLTTPTSWPWHFFLFLLFRMLVISDVAVSVGGVGRDMVRVTCHWSSLAVTLLVCNEALLLVLSSAQCHV